MLEDLKSYLPGYKYIGVGRDNGADEGEHAAIFYDTDKFDMLDHGDFWLSETPDCPSKGGTRHHTNASVHGENSATGKVVKRSCL